MLYRLFRLCSPGLAIQRKHSGQDGQSALTDITHRKIVTIGILCALSVPLYDGVTMRSNSLCERTNISVVRVFTMVLLRNGLKCLCLALLLGNPVLNAQSPSVESFAANLLFHASFDQSTTADFAKGNPTLFEATSIDARVSSQPFSHESQTVNQQSEGGRFAGCLRFERKTNHVVFYKVHENFPNPAELKSGTVSFWLKTDPESELREGFCDPIQVTSKQWDDAAFFVEFEKRPGKKTPFRLGVYADKHVWNPQGIDFANIPPEKRPLTTVDQPPFQKDKWVHVAFTFSNFNSHNPDATSELYLDGSRVGSLSPRLQTFTWDIDRAAIMLGLSYVGSMDDLAIFNRALTAKEIEAIHKLPGGIKDLLPRTNQ